MRSPPSTRLYASCAPEIALWEMVRRSVARDTAFLRNNVLTEIRVGLGRVVDLAGAVEDGAIAMMLTGGDVAGCQRLAAVAVAAGIEAMLVPSAAMPGRNLVVFPRCLRGSSRLQVVGSVGLPLDVATGGGAPGAGG